MDAEPGLRRALRSTSPEATEALGERLGALLSAGDRVALSGEMGSGKTTLVRGLARGLGVSEPVASPSYTLMQRHEGRVPLYHFDAWMEGRERAFLLDGGGEVLEGDGVAVVEWAERIEDWLHGPHAAVELSHLAPRERRIVLSVRGAGPGALELARRLEALSLPPGVEEAPQAAPEAD